MAGGHWIDLRRAEFLGLAFSPLEMALDGRWMLSQAQARRKRT